MLLALLHQFVELDPAEFVAEWAILRNSGTRSIGYFQLADHLAVTFDIELTIGLFSDRSGILNVTLCEPCAVFRH
ncbi:protein of unknown function [Candidatus Nitrospira inopinata]|jgi:hypothetical protein|uniref:Uncharacterized protein n=1 Tax=Candidatus Nitrospira inopinata TaxID=1715989 RepID=A0A0S4KP54_9BACT|nr:protein of unknown function [Candidatus Nitrospira inopinata]